MNIFFDATVLEIPLTGIGKTMLQLYENCLSQMDSLKITGIHRRPLSVNLTSKIGSVQLGNNFPGPVWRSFILPAYLNKKTPDIMHFPWNGKVPYNLKDIKVITTLHDVLPLIIPHYFRSKIQEVLYKRNIQKDMDRSNLIVTDSNFSKKEIMDNFDVDTEILVLHHGPTIKPPSGGFSVEKSNYFLYVGGYDPRKGLEKLIERFIILNKEKKLESRLIVVGEKNYYSKNLKILIEEGISKGFLEEKGYVSDDSLAKLYSNALALVYPSRYEGFGLPPLEAMNLGCPVITTKCTSIPEICGNAAYYVDLNEDLDEALITLENDPTIREKLSLKGKKQAARFSWESTSKIFLNKIENL